VQPVCVGAGVAVARRCPAGHRSTGRAAEDSRTAARSLDHPARDAYREQHLFLPFAAGRRAGHSVERRIQVVNGTGSRAHVSTYPAATRIMHGEFIGARGHSRKDLSTWTSTRPKSLNLARNGRSFVHVTIRVPPDAASGERYGVVWAQTTTAHRPQEG
jgi:hypothetical protein